MIEQIIDRLELLIEENIRSCGEENSLMCHDRNFGIIQAIECIEKMEKQPKTDWIPCEVDMPKKEYGAYWIAVEVERDKPYYYCSAVWTSKDGFRTHDIEAHGKIVAWQPIQLYKKEGAE